MRRNLLRIYFCFYAFLLAFANLGLCISNLEYKKSNTQNTLELSDKGCPQCFNCLLPNFSCKQFASCNQLTGRCDCPAGFGGDDCIEPLCGSLADNGNRYFQNGTKCDCDEGWSGINCNVCESNNSCNAFFPEGIAGTCYKGGILVHENFQNCKVVNKQILAILNGQIPEVTFTCNKTREECNFQFWIDQRESFYCGLSSCSFSYENSRTNYRCENIHCSCVPDRMLCGENGSIDLTDFLAQSIKGPGYFSCDNDHNCEFSEPNMNELIKNVFGDPAIFLSCNSGECLYYTDIPGFVPPEKSLNKKLLFWLISGATFIAVTGIIIFFSIAKCTIMKENGPISLPDDDEFSQMMIQHKPVTVAFESIGYSVDSTCLLKKIKGIVYPGQIMAIMGGSGAGKTTLLDILAGKNKAGKTTGRVLFNGEDISSDGLQKISGFVDQDDHLLSTMTVYETVLFSALLRLPKSMSYEAKRARVFDTLSQLDIFKIKDHRIGNEEARGISGGEKKRVAIACELVTSPSVLFLDEPTSGLDSYNAIKVVDSLKNLASKYNRTVIFTIHQPRSNIVSLFDRLILLGNGKLVYSGEAARAQAYMSSIGYECPPGYNIADYLVDLTMNAALIQHSINSGSSSSFVRRLGDSGENGSVLTHSKNKNKNKGKSISNGSIEDSEIETGKISNQPNGSQSINFSNLDTVVQKYYKSTISSSINSAIEEQIQANENSEENDFLFSKVRSLSIGSQFLIISGRTFKNIYRSPMLFASHYVTAILLGFLCGFFFYNISNDIAGFQNRLGLFFFLLTLFGFSTLTSITVFANERALFMRERAKGYYSPFAYFSSKVLLDIIPLRILPPLIFGLIIYPLVGLSYEDGAIWKFFLVLLVFNLASAATCFLIGVVIRDGNVATFVGILVTLFNLLFAGLLLNKDSTPHSVSWMRFLFVFHYAFEALAVNEVKYLTLEEKKFGFSIEVPGATILSTFGYNVASYWLDTGLLVFISSIVLIFTFLGIKYLLVEVR